ncbi:tetraspanin-32 [Talpa occidentalis]|uniref:tetraspanin-32 n=1 Tax=Talpa occidentalis TaxID=50954 RepID=UPI0023F670ED|nr:tetraspanin-32 [Talpa occidentalis]
MGPRRRVRVAKCQMLVTSFFVLVLGLSVAAVAALTYFGAHFAVISRAAWERAPHGPAHFWAVSLGTGLAGLLILGALLSAAATVREAAGLMAGGFLCFALVFCALVLVAFWRFQTPMPVEDAALDAYDLLYDRALRRSPAAPSRELVAVQDTFLCCGKSSPFGLLGSADAHLCQGPEAARQGCLSRIRGFLRTHATIASALTTLGLACTVYAMLLSSFLWFAIRAGYSLDRKGKYTLKSSPVEGQTRTRQHVPRPRPGRLRAPADDTATSDSVCRGQAARGPGRDSAWLALAAGETGQRDLKELAGQSMLGSSRRLGTRSRTPRAPDCPRQRPEAWPAPASPRGGRTGLLGISRVPGKRLYVKSPFRIGFGEVRGKHKRC